MDRIELLKLMGMSIEEATERAEQEEAARQAFRATVVPAPEQSESHLHRRYRNHPRGRRGCTGHHRRERRELGSRSQIGAWEAKA